MRQASRSCNETYYRFDILKKQVTTGINKFHMETSIPAALAVRAALG
jgi:6,7-dimethyl-8-ribityllumazine synthase